MRFVRCLIIAGAVMLVGCHASHSIVGTWNVNGGPSAATFTFQKDGNFNTEATMPGRHSTLTGQYEQKGNRIEFKTLPARTATLDWKSADEVVMTGDDGKAKTLTRQK